MAVARTPWPDVRMTMTTTAATATKTSAASLAAAARAAGYDVSDDISSCCLRESHVEGLEVCVHPSRSGDLELGVREHMDAMLLRYKEEYGGVVLAYHNVVIHGSRVPLLRGLNPYLRVPLSCRLLLFCPQPGSKLLGRVNNIGDDFVGLLVLGVFNATVSDEHMHKYRHVKNKHVWKHKDDPKERIRIGSLLRVQVLSVDDSGPVLDIRAALGPEGTGLVHQSGAQGTTGVAGSTPKADEAVHLTSPAAAATTPSSLSGKKKAKRKRGDEAPTDARSGEENRASFSKMQATATAAAIAGMTPQSEPGRKKKKMKREREDGGAVVEDGAELTGRKKKKKERKNQEVGSEDVVV